MAHASDSADPIVSEGRYAVVEGDESDAAEFWLVVDDADYRVPLEETTLDDAATVLSRFRNARTDSKSRGPETDSGTGTELSCHSCGKTWTYTGSNEHIACPNCETEVPVEGIGP